MNQNTIPKSSDICWFAMKMAEEIQKNTYKKTSSNITREEDMKNFIINEIRRKLDIIEKLTVEDRDDIDKIIKQFTHIANHAMIGFIRCNHYDVALMTNLFSQNMIERDGLR